MKKMSGVATAIVFPLFPHAFLFSWGVAARLFPETIMI
ncbi:hypothetical protein B4096_1680 [Heyndrickxia coagulans]|nr:hypothetical protein B4096_1680 [Heyndrickxia coagulans]